MDSDYFLNICTNVTENQINRNGIGTLGEKTIHAVLKQYLSTPDAKQEQKVHNYVADIVDKDHVIEIQTRNFNNLRKKLDLFLKEYKVTIVYPIAHTKWLCWINEETGEVSKPRKSPKTGSPITIFPELYRIKSYLKNPNLSFHIVLLDIEEYRLLNGWSHDKKKGSSRNDGIPVSLYGELMIQKQSDYAHLIPDVLPHQFTTADYKKAAHISQKVAWTALNILSYMDVIKLVGKQGRYHLFERT